MPDDESKASILLIDDHPLLRQGVRQLIDMEDDMVVVGEASNARDGVKLAAELDPDLILLDLNMPEIGGIEALGLLRQESISSRIVIFTVSDNEDDVVAALRAGADGYLLKDMEPEDMLARLHEAAVGKMVISGRLTTLLAQALRTQKPELPKADGASLTPRERDILALIAEGLSNKMIGRRLDISDGTVKVHVKHLLKKLNLRSRVEAAVWAVAEGISR
ncbi:two-component system response regulator NarL [Hydrocarboniclastica marina]|uniref:Two-component system response regulator NarL n=1 Tax=Hydrocarboniclastica marina TaxID=2259620 RepID=A0A4P7XKY1_9ALTE|nr:two-component system response regulator NarL [Hydrocarboniclastica marina]MAM00246.1 two-component system response regulator NarL [Alteromonadaceae bacterium]QCF27575.1 two-component system response regulator NarL [Hydrocarboniclastica marina]|tara:strand:- start:894 stop:1553 length:660 start_codon:yes stop_codon:yes gene_type:complete